MNAAKAPAMGTVSLAKVSADFARTGRMGPPPRKGWLAAIDSSGTAVMVAGKAARHILYQSAENQGWTVCKIVADKPSASGLDEAIKALGGNPDESLKPYDVLQVQRDGKWLDFSTIREGDFTAVWGILRRGFDGGSREIPAESFRVIRPGFNPERIVVKGGSK